MLRLHTNVKALCQCSWSAEDLCCTFASGALSNGADPSPAGRGHDKTSGDPFAVGFRPHPGRKQRVGDELGGMAGVIAPIIGKKPADYHIWILPGAEPAFIREEGPLYEGGPVWRIEQISPTFPN